MKNTFKLGVENTREAMAAKAAAKEAKKIQQLDGADVYHMMKKGEIVPIIVDGQVIGGATSEDDAKAAVDFLKSFTQGLPLDKTTLMAAGMRAIKALEEGNSLADAEKSGIGIYNTYKIKDKEYVVDTTYELYTISGDHITNIADIITARESGALSEKLFNEILEKRILEWAFTEVFAEKNDDVYEDEDEDDE